MNLMTHTCWNRQQITQRQTVFRLLIRKNKFHIQIFANANKQHTMTILRNTVISSIDKLVHNIIANIIHAGKIINDNIHQITTVYILR